MNREQEEFTALGSLLDLFESITTIPAVSGSELLVAQHIIQRFDGSSIQIEMDSAGEAFGGNCGNLILTPAHFDPKQPAIMFTAHMDTVRNTNNVVPQRKVDRITSDGKNQLGVDNRAGLAILIYLLEHYEAFGLGKVNFLILFTVAEESGMNGAANFDASPYNIVYAFVFDSSNPPGTFILNCAGMYLFDVIIKGKAAHSAVNPEEGINAIEVAAHALSKLRFGRIDQTTTANIGTIKGGEATNVIAPECRLQGEVRALDTEKINILLTHYQRTFEKVAGEYGAEVIFNARKDFQPYQIDLKSDIVQFLERAITLSGLSPNPITYTGGSDANVFNDRGILSINLGIGAQNPHSNDEFILYSDLISTLKIARQMLTLFSDF